MGSRSAVLLVLLLAPAPLAARDVRTSRVHTATTRLAATALVVSAASATAEPPPRTCAEEIGAKQAATLVHRCIEVSPATHPPCNAKNPCAMIEDEIRRGCAFVREGKIVTVPAFCNASGRP